MTDARRTTLELTGADCYIEVSDPTWGSIPGRLTGTPLDGITGFIVQIGDREQMRDSRVVQTREQAVELVIELSLDAHAFGLSFAHGYCVSPGDARYMAGQVTDALSECGLKVAGRPA